MGKERRMELGVEKVVRWIGGLGSRREGKVSEEEEGKVGPRRKLGEEKVVVGSESGGESRLLPLRTFGSSTWSSRRHGSAAR